MIMSDSHGKSVMTKNHDWRESYLKDLYSVMKALVENGEMNFVNGIMRIQYDVEEKNSKQY